MRHYLGILLLLLFAQNPVFADTMETNSVVVYSSATVTVEESGVHSATIDPDTGALSSSLSLDFAITANSDINNVLVRSVISDADLSQHSAFTTPSVSTSTSQCFCFVFTNDDCKPEVSSINNCKLSSCSASSNPDSIAYQGTITINNSGSISFVPNSGEGYFSCEVKEGSTNLNLQISTTPKPGTYDLLTALDEPGDYQVTIYLDNLP